MVPMEDDGFVDKAALQEVIEQATKTLRSLGLSVLANQVGFQMDPAGNIIALLPVVVRDSAKKKLMEDRSSREEFQQMMAAKHRAELDERAKKIAKVAEDPHALADFLFEGIEGDDDCSHERMHPDGFCLDCGKGMGE